MKTIKSLVFVASGAVAGVALIMSCSDDSPGDADAAECDCPSAETPITAGRFTFKTNPQTLGPGVTLSQGVACDGDGILIGGGCELQATGMAPDLVVTQSHYVGTTDWGCEWRNNSATETYQVQVEIKCLMPAQ